jgi:hypothetical protein
MPAFAKFVCFQIVSIFSLNVPQDLFSGAPIVLAQFGQRGSGDEGVQSYGFFTVATFHFVPLSSTISHPRAAGKAG